jgi:hypothetical protein
MGSKLLARPGNRVNGLRRGANVYGVQPSQYTVICCLLLPPAGELSG